jgi:predicted secreted protein
MWRRRSFSRKTKSSFVCATLFLLSALLMSNKPLIAKTITLKAVDNNTAICLVEGDTLVINLSSPLPNFRWKVLPQTSHVLTPTQQFASPDTADSKSQTFRFNAASIGTTSLNLGFLAPALDSAQQPGGFSVQVTVASGAPKSLVLIGAYKGTTACADCTGILTELRLYAKGPSDFTDNLYISTRTYQGGRLGDQSFTDRGQWFMDKGDAVDPNATVYALSPDDPQIRQYYLLQPGGASLTGLDSQMKPIDAPPRYQTILKSVK